jgi:predicted membrane protein
MIKTSTVIKRMVKDSWKPVSVIVGTVIAMVAVSQIAEHLTGVDSFTVYWGLILAWFVTVGIKWAFDAKRSQIEYEQKEMLRDLERKHL